MTTEQARSFVEKHGIVLESGKGPVPNVAEQIAGRPIRASWWGDPKASVIWKLTRALRADRDILVCRLVAGKITYVHRRLWPALVALADRFPAERLAAVEEVHLPSGRHEVRTTPLQQWVPRRVLEEAKRLTRDDAASQIGAWCKAVKPTASDRTSGTGSPRSRARP